MAPRVDLRGNLVKHRDLDGESPWLWSIDFVRRSVAGDDTDARRRLVEHTIKGFGRDSGADPAQLSDVIDTLEGGSPVAFYGWWPSAELAAVTDILGVDAIEVPTPDRKGRGLIDGHAVAIVGYGRHDAFPGSGYFIVQNPWRDGWGDDGVGYLPFTYLRTYAIALRTFRIDAGRARSAPRPRMVREEGQGASNSEGSRTDEASNPAPTAFGIWPHPADTLIAKRARCADPRSSYTHLFFSDNPLDAARAKAICTRCAVRSLCLARALERKEPFGVWGGEFVHDGRVVAIRRGRGRPRKVPLPTLVDEVTGDAIVA